MLKLKPAQRKKVLRIRNLNQVFILPDKVFNKVSNDIMIHYNQYEDKAINEQIIKVTDPSF